jgi:hypothetical protein
MFAGGNRDHGASNNRKGRPIHNLRTGRRELEVNPSHRGRPGYPTNSGQQFTPKGRKTLGGPKPWGLLFRMADGGDQADPGHRRRIKPRAADQGS